MARHFIMFSICYLQPLSLCPPSSIPCPPSILCHIITPSPLFLSSVLHHSLIPSLCIPVSQLPASSFHSIFIFSTSVHYSLPPHSNFVYLTFCPLLLYESFYTFSILPHSLYYSKPCSLYVLLTCSLFLSL